MSARYRQVVDDKDSDSVEDGSVAGSLASDDKEEHEEKGLMAVLRGHPYLTPFLIFSPIGFLCHFLLTDDPGLVLGMEMSADQKKALMFSTNFLAIIPLAWLIGKTTEDLAAHTSQAMGGFLNATFGNIVEMLLCCSGIMAGELVVVQCTLIGSILSNLLLVMGTSFIYGGYFHESLTFKLSGARTHASLLTLSIIGIALPTAYSMVLGQGVGGEALLNISRSFSVMMLVVYVQYLVFQLHTHKHLFEGEDDEEEEPDMSARTAAITLGVCTVITACNSEFLIHSIKGTIKAWQISQDFIGIILLPIIGNAAEHYTAITVAKNNRMDLSLGVAVGSAVQMALMVTPVSILFAWAVGQPLSLNFHMFHVVVLVLSVLIVTSILTDGQATWLQGSMLVSAYVMISWIYFNSEPAMGPATINVA